MDLLLSKAQGANDPYPATDLDVLERSLETVSDMLDRVLAYVRSVLSGEVKGDAAVGRYLLNTFGASTEELEKGAFHTSLQVSYQESAYPSQRGIDSRNHRTHSWYHILQTWFGHKQKFLLGWLSLEHRRRTKSMYNTFTTTVSRRCPLLSPVYPTIPPISC